MLQKLNERIQGVIAWLVIVVIAFTFTLFGVDYYMQSRQSSDTKAVINDVIISNQAFENSYRRARSQRDPAKITAAADKRLKNEVLETMISNTVAVVAAGKAGFEITPEQTNAVILGIPQFQEDGQFSSERYQQALNGALFTPETFQMEVRQGMLLNQQRFAFMGTSFVLPYEMERFIKLYMQTRDYDYLIIPSKLFSKDIHITSEDIKQFYEQHQSEFQSPEKVRIEYVKLSMPDIRAKIKINEEDKKNYYEENQNNFLMPAQWQVAHIFFAMPENASESEQEEILKKADDVYKTLEKSPEQFDEMVKLHSDDKLSISDKGLLPWIVAGQQPDLDKALISMNKSGQISSPIKTKNGYEIFRLNSYKPAKLKPFAEVDSVIQDQLKTELAQTQYTQLLEQLSDLSYQTPDSLQPVAETLKMPIQKTDFFSADAGNDILTKNKAVVRAAFSHDVLESGNNSEPVQVDNESVIVLRVNKHIPSSIKQLSEVNSLINEKLTHIKASEQAKNKGNQVLDSQEDALKFLSDNKLTWSVEKNISRDAVTKTPSIHTLAYQISKPETSKGIQLDNGDFAIVKLKQIHPGNKDSLDKEQLSNLAQQIEASYGMMDYDLYLNNLIKHAKIEKF